jgi:hypothetical protein
VRALPRDSNRMCEEALSLLKLVCIVQRAMYSPFIWGGWEARISAVERLTQLACATKFGYISCQELPCFSPACAADQPRSQDARLVPFRSHFPSAHHVGVLAALARDRARIILHRTGVLPRSACRLPVGGAQELCSKSRHRDDQFCGAFLASNERQIMSQWGTLGLPTRSFFTALLHTRNAWGP